MTARDSEALALFKAFDRNSDGRLNFEDLRQGFKDSGMPVSNELLRELLERCVLRRIEFLIYAVA